MNNEERRWCIWTMHSMNLVFLVKLGWMLISEKRIIFGLGYLSISILDEVAFSKLVRKQNSSNVWQGLNSAATLLLQGSWPKVQDRRNTYFWRDV